MRRLGSAAAALIVAITLSASGVTVVGAAEAGSEIDPAPGNAVFTVPGSHGFQVTILAYPSPAPDEPGTIAVVARSRNAVAVYRTPATISNRTVEADLGALGRISVRSVPTGRERTLPDACKGPGRHRIAAVRYTGTIEFLGEEGFTQVSATAAPFDYRTYLAFACAGEGGRPAGEPLPGAMLNVHRNPEENELMLQATQERPGAATTVWVQIDELRGELGITRATGTRTGPGVKTLGFDRRLQRATLSPPAPFAGHATFRRNAPPSRRWTGNLTVDLPGDADYPLTGPGLEVSLVHPSA